MDGESFVSTIHTVLLDTPHGCRVTCSPATAFDARPTHRLLSSPSGAYSISNAGSSTPVGPQAIWPPGPGMFGPPATQP